MPKPVMVALVPHGPLVSRDGRVSWRAEGRRFFTSTASLLAGAAPEFDIALPGRTGTSTTSRCPRRAIAWRSPARTPCA